MTSSTATGRGLATRTAAGEILSVWYPNPSRDGVSAAGDSHPDLAASLDALAGTDDSRGVTTTVVDTTIDLDEPPAGPADAYLRLHLLSHRLASPNTVNVESIFKVLNNVVWTSAGPCSPSDFEATRLRLMAHGHVAVFGVDKFPRMTDFVIPAGVRIADADRVRLGAHLAAGTTVMHEGFVNYNAGTLGAAMVEGRISAGVVVAEGSDVGGGASIMGTLSGGGTHKISIGGGSLLGANSGIGISIGNDCVVEAGLYVTAGTRVTVAQAAAGFDAGAIVKAAELSGRDNLLFRRNSTSGAVEVLARRPASVDLNPDLHAVD
ncbi:2,3,4,5-tetrahydropyridine-2,6-dicarboxylate N-succinyltransferase [Spelaeicoccus albus]|uniref:2,3,4,5-tetrahydropyridine-2,6-dicarboxylate N-succinyltransferase n=1 Tax=Spelaeicoccus albus TaxID=1280376 RepID=A0A7Z0II37_9MICO|nr:2,3,4,5-tetrahydropyridine-2,6-dicarboxylate N-succinyltransferase [Spelaeicoccus albus]NYI68076.1 2,3,4,5-tetrahydropyridine-2-carboxylate N-succinyltransferase [Spelaeicoccus albus]